MGLVLIGFIGVVAGAQCLRPVFVFAVHSHFLLHARLTWWKRLSLKRVVSDTAAAFNPSPELAAQAQHSHLGYP